MPELDGVRTIAIVAVLIVHLAISVGGLVGVTVFFCLSGYLIGSLLLQERAETGSIRLRDFYIRRFGRLYPALIVMIILSVPVFLVTVVESPIPLIAAMVLALTYTVNLFASVTGIWPPVVNLTWTLAQEEQFYLVAPWVLRRVQPSRFGRLAILLLVAAVVVVVVRAFVAACELLPWRFAYQNPILNLDGMLFGVALAAAASAGKVPRWFSRVGASIGGAIAAGVLLIVAVVFTLEQGWQWAAGLTVATIATLLLLTHISLTNGPVNRLLRLRPMKWVGQRSYGIYLYHYPIFLLFGATGGHPRVEQLGRDGLALVVSVTVAALSARWLEAPVRQWVRRRFSSASERQGSLTVAP